MRNVKRPETINQEAIMSKRKKWIGWVLTVLAVAPFVVSAAVKFAGIPQV